jgi:hypothetical protein
MLTAAGFWINCRWIEGLSRLHDVDADKEAAEFYSAGKAMLDILSRELGSFASPVDAECKSLARFGSSSLRVSATISHRRHASSTDD